MQDLVSKPGFDINGVLVGAVHDAEGEATPLMIAALAGHADVIRVLQKVDGFDARKVTKNGTTALFLATLSGNFEAVHVLLQAGAGATINRATVAGGQPSFPLFLACEMGDLKLVDRFLEVESIDVNKRISADGGYTPLLVAAQKGYTAVVVSLLGAPDIDPNKATTDDGTTPLWSASENGHLEVVKVLLAAPSIDASKARTSDRSTPLCASAACGHEQVVRALLQSGMVDANQCNGKNQTPLHFACDAGHTSIVRALLAVPGIDAIKKDDWGDSPEMSARKRGHGEIVGLIEQHHASLLEETPLIQAALQGRADRVRELLQAGIVDINETTPSDGSTALFQAAMRGHEEIVRQLLEASGVDADLARLHDGFTPLFIACMYQVRDCCRLLSMRKTHTTSATVDEHVN